MPWSERFSAWLGGLVPAPALRLAVAAAAVALVAVAGYSVWQTAALHRQVARLEASQQQLAGERADLARREQELDRELAAARRAAGELRASDDASSDELAAASRRIEELEGEVTSLRRLPKPRRQEITASFLLALATRSSGVPELVLPDAADTVSLQLQTGDGAYYDSFQVRLLGAGGAEVWSRTGLAATAATGTVDVDAAGRAPRPRPLRGAARRRRRRRRQRAGRRLRAPARRRRSASPPNPISPAPGAPDAGGDGTGGSPGGGRSASAPFFVPLRRRR